MKSLLTFPKGGVHPPEFKAQTQGLGIEIMPVPDELELILGQHIGAPCQPIVAKREEIGEGALIGEVKKGLGVPLHAPVAGKIKDIGNSVHPVRVSAPSITLTVNREVEAPRYEKEDWQHLNAEELLARVYGGGIIGIGGAGFPTHVKLKPPANAPVDTLILNGAECEPYITADHRAMLEYSAEIVEGAKIILKILGIKECHIGIENNKPDAILAMNKAAELVSTADASIKIRTLQVKYPQGSEKQLIHAVTGRKVPAMALPSAVGVVVQNVCTAKAIYDAVVYRKP
ncbi:MAG: RnfABCDGE type electron transport complex subunit C, partial [Proteobacteria bacterium]|nr:RnfABCDGE type electron transport complex subunit C [Pseudomonadota bacterium]